MDFVKVKVIHKQRATHIMPEFLVKSNIKDVMFRGKSFYAVWDESTGLWSTDEGRVQEFIDYELNLMEEKMNNPEIQVDYMSNFSTNSWNTWQKYCKTMPDNYHELDKKVIFANTETKRTDYASKKLPYAIEKTPIKAYDKIMSTLYLPEEREKLEWSIGSIITGDSTKIQKFIVLYGGPGTGKSTVLNIIQQLFQGYCMRFNAKDLAGNASFALEQFHSNPLVAIQHDGDLSHIEDNTKLNSIVSHEKMVINEKYKSQYEMRIQSFLFMGTNKPVHISDAKSGLLRRLIDVHPSNQLLKKNEYDKLMAQIPFELGGIAKHCLDVYQTLGPDYYEHYVPEGMMMATNDFYDFMEEHYDIFSSQEYVLLDTAWMLYQTYNEKSAVAYPYPKRRFREELKNYFDEYEERKMADGKNLRHYYAGFQKERFGFIVKSERSKKKTEIWLKFNTDQSIFDHSAKDYPAQLAKKDETPMRAWDECRQTLKDIDTRKLHYVYFPKEYKNHIVIDFDLKDENGEKSLEKNMLAASKFPETYAEVSKSGAGIHLHYIYAGDVKELSRVYDEGVEIKVFTGNSSLRRRLTKCNDLPIATISSGLPLKEKKGGAMLDDFTIKNEKMLRKMIYKNLKKEYHIATKPSIDYIVKILDDAYEQGLSYDVSDMKQDILTFAMGSTNQSDYCIKAINRMKFASEEKSAECNDTADDRLVFYDIEAFPNLFLINWKYDGGSSIVRMINPKPEDVADLFKMRLIGFNCRRYDNHLIYAASMGYSNEMLFKLSQRIINDHDSSAMFGEAYNLSYTDVYDFASAGNKKSLKKLEIEMGIHHKELGLPWDQPVPEEKWEEVAAYCDNDVIATEAAFHYLKGDWIARQILADLAGMTVNDTTNTLSQRIIFGKEKHPQKEFNYRDLAKPVGSDQYNEYLEKFGTDYRFRVFDQNGMPQFRDYKPGEVLPDGWSILPFFPGYEFNAGVSTYLGEIIGEGGRVFALPGMYSNVWDADVAGQHPSSIIAEVLFGPKYTKAFKEIVDGRVSIKHSAWSDIDELFDGKLKPYIQKVLDGELTNKQLSDALKTVVNSVYGLTSASFDNCFRDLRNKDNIVAKRGALFMTLLTRVVQDMGYKVVHNKTDSIKIVDADERIRNYVFQFGREYGYEFETEAEFEKFCLVNDAVYVAKTKDGWLAVGKQFQVPYVFKTLFSKEPIEFEDYCETFSVSKGALYLDMNEGSSDHNYVFVGRIGQFCPIMPFNGAGELVVNRDDKYSYAAGSKGYLWLESEIVKAKKMEDCIDVGYYRNLVDKAIDTISGYGDFEWFVSDIEHPHYDFMNIPEDAPPEGLPFI